MNGLLGGADIATAVLAGVKSFPGPHGKLFLSVDSDPNGVVRASAGSVAILRNGGTSAWINTDGETAWWLIGNWVYPGGSALRVYFDKDFGDMDPIDIKANGDNPFVRDGLTIRPVNTLASDAIYIDEDGLFLGNTSGANNFQQATPSSPSILISPLDVLNVAPSAIAEQWVWLAFRMDEADISRNWNYTGGGFRWEWWLNAAIQQFKSAGFYISGTVGNTYPKRLFASRSVTPARTTVSQLVVPLDESPVFAMRSVGFSGWEVHVGNTIAGGWPSRSALTLLYKYSDPGMDYGWTNSIASENTTLDFSTAQNYFIRLMTPVARSGQATWGRFTKLKIEAELRL